MYVFRNFINTSDSLFLTHDFFKITNLYFFSFSGNVFVIAAIILERNLQNVANYLVASLAVADLMVACLVMPLGAVYEVFFNRTTSLSDRKLGKRKILFGNKKAL